MSRNSNNLFSNHSLRNNNNRSYSCDVGNNLNNRNNNDMNNPTILRQTNQRVYQNYVKLTLRFIEELQKCPQMQTFINILVSETKQTQKDLQICQNFQHYCAIDQQFDKEVQQRCLRIQNNNNAIMQAFFQFKDIMSRKGFCSNQRDHQIEHHYGEVQQKINLTKLSIQYKLKKLRNNRQMAKKKINKKVKRQDQIHIPCVALDELHTQAAILNLALINQRNEIQMLIKQLYDKEI